MYRCPNCDAVMNEGDACPECDHTEEDKCTCNECSVSGWDTGYDMELDNEEDN